MSLLFEVKDPRGMTVFCEEEQYYNHICGNHAEMEGCEEDIKLAIQEPENGFIYQDQKRPDRYIYYKLDGSRRFYTKVVVEFQSDTGRVITAFRPDRTKLKSGEMLIWF